MIFETAAIKAARPDADYDIDALLSRMSKMEKTLSEIKENGIVVTGKSQSYDDSELKKELESLKKQVENLKNELLNVQKTATVKPQVKNTNDEFLGFDEYIPPEDDMGGAFIGFDDVTTANKKQTVKKVTVDEKPIVKPITNEKPVVNNTLKDEERVIKPTTQEIVVNSQITTQNPLLLYKMIIAH